MLLKFGCLPTDDQFKNKSFFRNNEESKIFETQSCIFALAVVGKQSKSVKRSRYVIEVKGAKYHKQLELKKQMSIAISPKQSRYYRLTISNSDTNHLYTNFKFNVLSGEADVYISRSSPFPDESTSI